MKKILNISIRSNDLMTDIGFFRTSGSRYEHDEDSQIVRDIKNSLPKEEERGVLVYMLKEEWERISREYDSDLR